MQGKNISHQGEDKRKKKLRRGRRGGVKERNGDTEQRKIKRETKCVLRVFPSSLCFFAFILFQEPWSRH